MASKSRTWEAQPQARSLCPTASFIIYYYSVRFHNEKLKQTANLIHEINSAELFSNELIGRWFRLLALFSRSAASFHVPDIKR